MNKKKFQGAFIGCADIGSNKCHFTVYDQNGKQVAHTGSNPALGHGLSSAPPFFLEKNFGAALIAIKQGADLFKSYKVAAENAHCAVTAAMREFMASLAKQTAEFNISATLEGSRKLKALVDAFHPYSFTIVTAEQEAELVAIAAMDELYPDSGAFDENSPLTTIAHCGGRSTELITVSGGLMHQTYIAPCGVLTLEKSLAANLKENWPANEKPRLAVGGGIWRRVGKFIDCEGMILSCDQIEQRLINLSDLTTEHFIKLGAEERAPTMAAGAANLLGLIRHTDAKEIIFLKQKMVTALQPRIHQKWAERLIPPPPTPPRPCAPSAQAQARPA